MADIRTRGFTLIELLVAISIISLLSSIIFASLSNARESARLAAGMQASTNYDRTVAANAVGIWSFEEMGAGTTHDASGFGFTGTLVGGAQQINAATCDLGFGGCLQLDGTGYVTTALKDEVGRLHAVGGNQFATSAWVNRSSGGVTDQVIMGITGGVGTGATFVVWATTGGKLRVRFNGGTITDLLDNMETGKWYFVTIVWDGATMLGYIDGGSPMVLPIGGAALQDFSFTMGARSDGSNNRFVGMIDEVRVFNTPLTAQEVGALYAAGAPKHRLASAE